MVSFRLIVVCLAAGLLSGAEAFGILSSRGVILAKQAPSDYRSAGRSIATRDRSAISQRRRSMAMEVNPREESDYEMTVDWDEELRKLNASELGKPRANRDPSQDDADPEMVKWAKQNARKAQSAAQETTYQVRGAMRKAPQWQTVSRDYRFWLGLVVGLSLLTSILSATNRSQDLVVWNDVMTTGGDEVSGAFTYAALMAAATTHAAGDAASQLAETGAAFVFA